MEDEIYVYSSTIPMERKLGNTLHIGKLKDIFGEFNSCTPEIKNVELLYNLIRLVKNLENNRFVFVLSNDNKNAILNYHEKLISYIENKLKDKDYEDEPIKKFITRFNILEGNFANEDEIIEKIMKDNEIVYVNDYRKNKYEREYYLYHI